METQTILRTKIRRWIVFFVVMLVLSGVTAFPLETELHILLTHLDLFPGPLQHWLRTVGDAVIATNTKYPFLAYGTDWLAFAHLVIAVAFIGPWQDPVRNSWVIRFGMIACALVIPLALIAGPIRHIPVFWRLVDCSFGVLGILPLFICYRLIKKLERLPLA